MLYLLISSPDRRGHRSAPVAELVGRYGAHALYKLMANAYNSRSVLANTTAQKGAV